MGLTLMNLRHLTAYQPKTSALSSCEFLADFRISARQSQAFHGDLTSGNAG